MLNITTDMAEKQGLSEKRAYEAHVVDNQDPKGWCRIRARVPFIFDGISDEHLPWAIAQFEHADGAGPGSGTQYVPKIGTKVILRFQDGDATSPMWEGYPVDKTTILQEMAHNYPDRKVTRLQNKCLVVIDTKSNEVFIRHPGDTKIYIEGNLELHVHGNVTERIDGNKKSFIEGDSTEVIKGDRKVYVGGSNDVAISGNSTTQTEGNYVQSTTGNSLRTTGGSGSISVGGSDSYQVGGTHTRSAAMIYDNGGTSAPTPTLGAANTPATPDLDKWVGIDGGAPGSFVKGFSPQADPVDVASSMGEDQGGQEGGQGGGQSSPPSPETIAAYKAAGIPLNKDGTGPAEDKTPIKPGATNTTEPTPATALPSSCSEFADKTSFPSSMQLSPGFTLGDVSTNALLERSSVQAQAGLTAAQIVCNLKGLCVNMLEPLAARYGRPAINCGFRPANASYGSPTGWHLKGAAADLQWGGISDEEYYNRAVWIKDNLPFCEVILEYGGRRPWIHVAFQASSLNTTNFKTRTRVPSTYSKGILKLTNQPGVGGS